jgi:hypothetical protein
VACLLLEPFDELTLVGSRVLSLALSNALPLEISDRTTLFEMMMMMRRKPLL